MRRYLPLLLITLIAVYVFGIQVTVSVDLNQPAVFVLKFGNYTVVKEAVKGFNELSFSAPDFYGGVLEIQGPVVMRFEKYGFGFVLAELSLKNASAVSDVLVVTLRYRHAYISASLDIDADVNRAVCVAYGREGVASQNATVYKSGGVTRIECSNILVGEATEIEIRSGQDVLLKFKVGPRGVELLHSPSRGGVLNIVNGTGVIEQRFVIRLTGIRNVAATSEVITQYRWQTAEAGEVNIVFRVVDFETGKPINATLRVNKTELSVKGEVTARLRPGTYIIEAEAPMYVKEVRIINITTLDAGRVVTIQLKSWPYAAMEFLKTAGPFILVAAITAIIAYIIVKRRKKGRR
jgi:hypothetical protein